MSYGRSTIELYSNIYGRPGGFRVHVLPLFRRALYHLSYRSKFIMLLWWEWMDSNQLTHRDVFYRHATFSNSPALPSPKEKARSVLPDGPSELVEGSVG